MAQASIISVVPGLLEICHQVRVRMRIECPPLDEDTFRSVLDHLGGPKFRLELSTYQVEQLLCLFASSNTCERGLIDVRGRSFYQTASTTIDPISQTSAVKWDSDSYSECSSRSTNFGEDEQDEASNGNGISKESMQMCHSQENGERILSERLSYISLDDPQSNGNGPPENKSDKELSYSAVLMSRLPAISEDNQSIPSDGNDKHMAWKGNSSSLGHSPKRETFRSVKDDAMMLRLHDTDPAVSSSSIDCAQANMHQFLARKGQDNVVRTPMVLSTVDSPFPDGENMVYPVHMVQCEKREIASVSKLKNHRKLSYGSPSSTRKFFNQDKVKRYRKQHFMSDDQQPTPIQSQNFQFSQVLLPFLTQRPGRLHEHGYFTTLLSPVFKSPHGQGLAFDQPLHRAGVEGCDEGYDTENDAQLQLDGLQNLLQNSHGPILLLPSIRTKMHGSSTLITAGFVEALHFDILRFARLTRPSVEIQLFAEAAIDCIRKGVTTVWSEADVEVFGSFATGLCLQHSDIDLAVIGAPLPPSSETLSAAQVSALLLRKLASEVQVYEWCESINVLDTALVPVLKCHCRPIVKLFAPSISMPSIAIDITIGGVSSDFVWNQRARVTCTADQVHRMGKFGTRHTGGAAREYVLQKIWELPALVPLVLLLKSFLYHKGLSNVYTGGLGSFSLTLLVAFYLEQVPISGDMPLDGMSGDSLVSHGVSSPLSCTSEFSEDSDMSSSRSSCGALSSNSAADFTNGSLGEHYVRRAADLIERVLTLWEGGGSPFLGTLLLGFLQMFGFVLDLSREKIVLKGIDGSCGGISKRANRHVALWIDDPLRPGVNVGAGSFGMCNVQAVFRDLLQVLTKCQLLAAPLGCKEEGCQDLAAMRQLSHLSRLVMEADDSQWPGFSSAVFSTKI